MATFNESNQTGYTIYRSSRSNASAYNSTTGSFKWEVTHAEYDEYKEKNMKVYWENTKDGNNKFWAARIFCEFDGKTNKYVLVRKWGKIGTKGQTFSVNFNRKSQALAELTKLVRSKEAAGYKGIF